MREPITAAQQDSPAAALGPTALVFGAIAALTSFVISPFALIAGGLAVTFGAAGMHYARQGIGRMWPATLGTVLGTVGLLGIAVLLGALGA
ncbi:hypothetical protein ACM01_08500 [Streptomyces viridochromogenes]|uniref:Integral membrane protein n=1 Tax=Streptomyces viridochromogenes TaxID=1938 RepID=A0A0J7ZIR5_STRVR|nr:hypothetical protein [Streptomyces viridochromogenes]KMS75784.1 hypothetical protein ACM01_08500 [Streptomyces viridochromogenes]KOG16984.1 hypothetical protein ADK36_26025 [Streptomyces viridochromogenes]KOG18094.1 hypothetical protein ADK35_22970 [Streptomyces viridochromogenes]